MKKFIVIALMLLGLVSNVSAGSAPAAYYWDIIGIASSQAVDTNGVLRAYEWEYVSGGTYSTSWNHGGAVYAAVYVEGYSNPVVTFNNSGMQLVDVDSYDLNGDGTIDAWMYYYGGSGSSGNIEVKDWSGSTFSTRDTVYVK